jgi:hypothetical protein
VVGTHYRPLDSLFVLFSVVLITCFVVAWKYELQVIVDRNSSALAILSISTLPSLAVNGFKLL